MIYYTIYFIFFEFAGVSEPVNYTCRGELASPSTFYNKSLRCFFVKNFLTILSSSTHIGRVLQDFFLAQGAFFSLRQETVDKLPSERVRISAMLHLLGFFVSTNCLAILLSICRLSNNLLIFLYQLTLILSSNNP